MKKNCFIVFLLAGLMSFYSCGTTESFDYDAAIQNILQNEDVAVFTVGRNLIVEGIDDVSADKIEGYSGDYSNHKTQIFTVAPGIHSVSVRYKKDKSSSLSTYALYGMFESGKRYAVKYRIISHSISFDIIDEETSESVFLGGRILH